MELNDKQIKDLVARRHPEYEKKKEHWDFLASTYAGGRGWFTDNIFRYFKEGDQEFKERVERAYRFNHTREVVNLINKYLFKEDIHRNIEEAPEQIRNFWKRATRQNASIDSFMAAIDLQSSIYGRISGSTQGTAGIQMYEAYNNSYPTTYGNVLHMKGASAAGEGELLIGWSGTSGAHAPVFIRSRRDYTGAAWSAWAQVYTAKDSIPGVNTTGNQNTTGNAATATKLQTARKIAGVAFDGSADITLTAANLNAYTKTEVTNLLSSYASRSSLTGYSGNLDIIAETLVVKSGGSGGFAIWDIGTTTSGANMYIDPNPGINTVWRSTSSRRYKKDIETLQDRYADELLSLRPVWYRSICRGDRKDWGYYGLIAEEVGEIAPQYVHWREPTNNDSPEDISSNGMVAEGVMYERLVVPLIHHIQQLTKRVEELETKLNSPKE